MLEFMSDLQNDSVPRKSVLDADTISTGLGGS